MTDTDTKTDDAAATGPEPDQAPAKPDWWVRHYTFFGTAVGLVFVWLSLTPSLLPRGPLFQGLVSGAAGGVGSAVIQIAQYDPLRDQGTAYADALRAAGVEVHIKNYREAVHGYASIPGLVPQAKQALADAITEIRRCFDQLGAAGHSRPTVAE